LVRLKGDRKHPHGRVFEEKGADSGTRGWFTAAVNVVGMKDYSWHDALA